jgi:hypothetical protein
MKELDEICILSLLIHVIRSATIALAMISMRINAPVEVSGHRQDMGECDTDVGSNSV